MRWPKTPKVYRIRGPFVLFHGGLGDARPSMAAAFLKSLEQIAAQIQARLQKKPKTSAVDLAVSAAGHLEDDPLFNAGYGAKIQSDGVARVSAAVMDGARSRLAGVSNLQSIRHPSQIALTLLDADDRILSSLEANRYAFARGFEPENLITPERLAQFQKKISGKTGTIGAIALDFQKRTAACTSTGGKGFEMPGRTSDSCTPAGNFANPFGAVSCTGTGEEIMEAAVASSICARLEDKQSLASAIQKTFRAHLKSSFGLIAISARGEVSVHATQSSLCFGLVTQDFIKVGTTATDWLEKLSIC